MLQVQEFFDPTTFTLSYIVFEDVSRDAIIIDPVLDFDPAASRIRCDSLEKILAFIRDKNLKPRMLLETHAHADHLSASQELKTHFPELLLGVGEGIVSVQKQFKQLYNLAVDFPEDGRQFDCLFTDGQLVEVGALRFYVLATPGHTPACVAYLFDDKVFTGDTLFMPDYGTGRCDFPGGCAEELYRSVTSKLYTLPDTTLMFTGHDYMPKGRPLRFSATIGEQKQANIHLNAQSNLDAFVKFRRARDANLDAPRLFHPSIQVNISGGRLPEPEANGLSYLKLPLSR